MTKSRGMWCWMEVVKEGFLPMMGLEPGIMTGRLWEGT